MELILNQIFETPELSHLFDDDDEINYNCSEVVFSKKFSHLQKCAINTNKFPFLNDYILKFLVDNPETINYQNEEGWTALMIAVRNSRTCSTEKTVEILLDNFADPNLQSNDGLTALMIASINSNQSSSPHTVKLLLDYQADVNMKCFDYTALAFACIRSNEETVLHLLKHKSNVRINIDKKPLIAKIYDEYVKEKVDIRIIAWLILYGANLNSLPEDFDLVKKINSIDFMIEYKSKLAKHIRDNELEISIGDCSSCENTETKGIKCHSKHFTCLQCLCIKDIYNCLICENNQYYSHYGIGSRELIKMIFKK